MTEQLLLLFQALFLILLYVFIWRLLRSANRDLAIAEKSAALPEPTLQPQTKDTRQGEVRLVVISSDSLAPGSVIRASGSVSIGRSPENAVTLLDDNFVSAQHARVEIDGPTARVTDLDSRNGTFLNGERIVNVREVELGDIVRVGMTELKLTQ